MELDAAPKTYPPVSPLAASGDSRSPFSFSLPLELPSLAPNLCLDEGPLLVCGRGGSEAVRALDMNSPSLLPRFEDGALISISGLGSVLDWCLSWELVEKRFGLVNGERVLEFISTS